MCSSSSSDASTCVNPTREIVTAEGGLSFKVIIGCARERRASSAHCAPTSGTNQRARGLEEGEAPQSATNTPWFSF